jgi:hypothetical protein
MDAYIGYVTIFVIVVATSFFAYAAVWCFFAGVHRFTAAESKKAVALGTSVMFAFGLIFSQVFIYGTQVLWNFAGIILHSAGII